MENSSFSAIYQSHSRGFPRIASTISLGRKIDSVVRLVSGSCEADPLEFLFSTGACRNVEVKGGFAVGPRHNLQFAGKRGLGKAPAFLVRKCLEEAFSLKRERGKRFRRFVRAVLTRSLSGRIYSWKPVCPSASIRWRKGLSGVLGSAGQTMAVMLNLLSPPTDLRALKILAPLISTTGVGRKLWFLVKTGRNCGRSEG